MKIRRDKFGNKLKVGQKVIASLNGETRAVAIVRLGSKFVLVDWRKQNKNEPLLKKVRLSDIALYERRKPAVETPAVNVIHDYEIGDVVTLLPRQEKDSLAGKVGRIIHLFRDRVIVLIPTEESGIGTAIAPVWDINLLDKR